MPIQQRRIIISVIGDSNPTPEVERIAEELGSELAKRGIVVVTGGLRGVMEAASKGAKLSGGITVGILPGNDRFEANPYIDIPICTGMGHGRNFLVAKSGLATIAVGGGYGTLSEIGHALSENIPVVGLNTWSICQSGRQEVPSIIIAKDPLDAVELALREVQCLISPSVEPGER